MTTFVSMAIGLGDLLTTLGVIILMGRPLGGVSGHKGTNERLGWKGIPVILAGVALTCSPLAFVSVN